MEGFIDKNQIVQRFFDDIYISIIARNSAIILLLFEADRNRLEKNMKKELSAFWYIVPVGVIASVFFGLIATVGFDQEVNEQCPATMEAAIGRSFDDLRRDCMGKTVGTPAPALTCGQLRLLSVSRSEDWPEGVVAREAERRHCMFSSSDSVTSVSDINTGQYDGIWKARFVFDDNEDHPCNWGKSFDVTIDNGSVEFSWLGRKYSGAITNNSWVMMNSNGISPQGLRFAVMGPILQPEVFHSVCGRGYMQMETALERGKHVSVR